LRKRIIVLASIAATLAAITALTFRYCPPSKDHRQWYRFAEHLSDASIEATGDAPLDHVIADIPVQLLKAAPEASGLEVLAHEGWVGMRGATIEAFLEIGEDKRMNLREIGGLQLRLRAKTPAYWTS